MLSRNIWQIWSDLIILILTKQVYFLLSHIPLCIYCISVQNAVIYLKTVLLCPPVALLCAMTCKHMHEYVSICITDSQS